MAEGAAGYLVPFIVGCLGAVSVSCSVIPLRAANWGLVAGGAVESLVFFFLTISVWWLFVVFGSDCFAVQKVEFSCFNIVDERCEKKRTLIGSLSIKVFSRSSQTQPDENTLFYLYLTSVPSISESFSRLGYTEKKACHYSKESLESGQREAGYIYNHTHY